MSFAALAVAAVVSVGATAGANAAKGKALSKSARIRAAAYDSLKPLNAAELQSVAKQGDLENIRNSLAAQRELDPTFAAIRDVGSKNILSALRSDQTPGQADKAASEIGSSLAATKADDEATITALMDKVKEDLQAGATLPPEFQAELVRSGLESAGVQGLNVSGKGAAGTQVRELLGSSGLALKQNREANARANLGAVDALRTGRQNALTRFAELTNNLTGAKMTRGGAGAALGQSMMPSIGLTGADLANVYQQNYKLDQAKTMGKAGVESDLATQKGALTASTIGAVGSGVNSMLGGWIGGLFGSGTAVRQPVDNTGWTPWKA